jgi:response regulator RpfG family c-di-GMP phosphodiesterase
MPHHFLSGHGRRVALISRKISRCLNLPEPEIVNIEIAALLHDIGKLSFPDKLIKYRDDEWNSEEQALFLRHPVEGQSIVQFVKSMELVGFMIRSHHERYDGQGYL